MEEIIAIVRKLVIEQSGDESIQNDDILVENGIDSVAMIDVVAMLEEEFDIEFAPEKLTYETLRTINTVSKYIDREINK